MHASEDRVYDILHPDQVITLASRVIIGVGGDNDDDTIPDHAEHIGIDHVVRLEEKANNTSNQTD